MKQSGRGKREAVGLAANRLRLVVDRKPGDVRFANDCQPGTGPDMRGRGMEPVARVAWRVIQGLRR